MFLNNTSKHGISLAEIIIAIAIVGAIAAIAMIVFTKSMPSKEEEIHKKISYLVEQVAMQMYDNETFYPRTNDMTKQGFLNTDEVSVDGVKYGGTTDDAQKEKFCKLFARQFNKINSNNVTCHADINTGEPSFRSVDGVDWWLPKTTFMESTNGQIKGFAKIKVDVNGKGKGSDCSAGENCKKPDTFFYYIKANGSVTLSNPTAFDDSSYKITRTIVTKDADGNVISSNSNNVLEIAPIDSSTGTVGDYSADESEFENLIVNKSYMLRAKPATGYVSNWATKETANETEKRYGYQRVHISRINTEVLLEFRQIKKYCIKLRVECDSENINSCIDTGEYKSNCKYALKGDNQGDYKRVSDILDNYDYVGPSEGSYAYECDNTGTALSVSGDYLTVCNLEPGDYQLHVVPKTGKYIKPRITENEYVQNVRLGTSDLTDFVVEIGEE